MNTIIDGMVQGILQVNSLSFGIGVMPIFSDFDRFHSSFDEMKTGVGEVGEGVADTLGVGGAAWGGRISMIMMVFGAGLTDGR